MGEGFTRCIILSFLDARTLVSAWIETSWSSPVRGHPAHIKFNDISIIIEFKIRMQ